MRIAIQAADLDASRIDGTRVYILNLLKHFGRLDTTSQFLIYHRRDFNPELVPARFPNYKIIKKSAPALWTQTRFAWELLKDKPDVLWMPMHNIPFVRRRGMKTVITVHDLAYKYFPEYFPKKELYKILFLTKAAVTKADKIIAISESTKKDILKFYPWVKKRDIRVIYHGFDAELFEKERDRVAESRIKEKYRISGEYILYSGAIQPRKNLEVLVEAFDVIKAESLTGQRLSLVLAGEKAWLSRDFEGRIRNSPYRKDIILTGRVKFSEMEHLYRGARAYVYPSLYDGFGITLLEAMASKIPLVCANNSSLPEVCGQAALYFRGNDPEDLAGKIKRLMLDETLKYEMVARGLEQIKKFSWERCAQETLDWIKG